MTGLLVDPLIELGGATLLLLFWALRLSERHGLTRTLGRAAALLGGCSAIVGAGVYLYVAVYGPRILAETPPDNRQLEFSRLVSTSATVLFVCYLGLGVTFLINLAGSVRLLFGAPTKDTLA